MEPITEPRTQDPPVVHRDVALLLLYDHQGKVLLQHRTKDAPFSPNMWGFFGGGMEAGETPEPAMRREIKEELHYLPVSPVYALQLPYKTPQRHGKRHIFVERYDISQHLVLGEGDAMSWFAFDEIDALPMGDFDKDALHRLERIVQERVQKGR